MLWINKAEIMQGLRALYSNHMLSFYGDDNKGKLSRNPLSVAYQNYLSEETRKRIEQNKEIAQ